MKPSTVMFAGIVAVCLVTEAAIWPLAYPADKPLNETAWLRACRAVESPDGKPGKAQIASWYVSDRMEGASNTFPVGSYVKVTPKTDWHTRFMAAGGNWSISHYLKNTDFIIIKIVSTGPYLTDSDGHALQPLQPDYNRIDLSEAAFSKLADPDGGVMEVTAVRE